ncbi:MAG: HPr kinase/phosphorylase [Marinosulfonomonas sp.]
MTDHNSSTQILHASCVGIDDAAVLIMGPSGSGKSGLALELMSRGASLIADDRTIVTRQEYGVRASCPQALLGKIEARGVGILMAEPQTYAPVRLVVDLTVTETDRLPPFRTLSVLGHQLPLVHGSVHSYFPAAIMQYLKGERIA